MNNIVTLFVGVSHGKCNSACGGEGGGGGEGGSSAPDPPGRNKEGLTDLACKAVAVSFEHGWFAQSNKDPIVQYIVPIYSLVPRPGQVASRRW